jgi:hypothetical protein
MRFFMNHVAFQTVLGIGQKTGQPSQTSYVNAPFSYHERKFVEDQKSPSNGYSHAPH